MNRWLVFLTTLPPVLVSYLESFCNEAGPNLLQEQNQAHSSPKNFCDKTLTEISPQDISTDLSSDTASYDGEMITLKGNVTLNHDLGQMKAGVATLNKGGPCTEFSSILLQQDVSIFLESQGNLFSDQAFFDFQTMTGEALCEDYPVIFKGNELDLFCKTTCAAI